MGMYICSKTVKRTRSFVQFLLVLVFVEGTISQFVRTFEQLDNEVRSQPTYSNTTFKTVCYYPLTSSDNTSEWPKGLNSTLCSHVIFIPTLIVNNKIRLQNDSQGEMVLRVIPVLRQQNPKLTILISSTGHFDPVMLSMQNTLEFVNTSVVFLRKYGFDGLDLDWEFPGWPVTDKPHGQIHNFSIVLTELRKAFEIEAVQTKRNRLLLTAAVSAGKTMAETIYETEYMKKAVDFVNMMGYDYNGWGLTDPLTAYNSPLFPEAYDKHFFNTNNLAWSASYWGSKVGKDKVMVGIPFYCRGYKLLSPAMHGYHAVGVGRGECDSAGYTCACLAIKNQNATRVFDAAAQVPYIYYGDQWVSYDDVESVGYKTKWIKDNGFAGLMTWNMIADDYMGICDGKTKYPLMKTVLKILQINS